jgi:hypothetical protein
MTGAGASSATKNPNGCAAGRKFGNVIEVIPVKSSVVAIASKRALALDGASAGKMCTLWRAG